MFWGLLGPETLNGERRTRTLGVGAAVRCFNDLAVPGTGGVWFGKQVLLATLGVATASRVRADGYSVQNIETANAIEALACWLALSQNQWQRDARLRGAQKLKGSRTFSFATVRKPAFYVTQPMRMSTVQALPALGLVEAVAERFNAFGCSDIGDQFIDDSCADFNPYNRSVLQHLIGWVSQQHNNVTNSDALRKALSPVEPLPAPAREFLRERLMIGSGRNEKRRCAAVDWMEVLRHTPQAPISWQAKPASITADHWRDLYVGALFFKVRDSAITVLDRLEGHLASRGELRLSLSARLPSIFGDEIMTLRHNATSFLDERHDPSPESLARIFCEECTQRDDANLIRNLVSRDGRVLCVRDDIILPGSAFRGDQERGSDTARSAEEVEAGLPFRQTVQWPEGISRRIQNLFMLNLDLHGELGTWLAAAQQRNSEEL